MSQSPFPLLPTYIVPEDTPIAACADHMKLNGVSALLVRDAVSSEITGIFTDRDLFLKMNSDMPFKVLVERPVRELMTSPVFCLDSRLIHLAPRLMTEKKIRHLPLIRTESDGSKTPLGILTLENVLRESLAKNPKSPADLRGAKPAFPPMTIGVLSEDRALLYRMSQAMADTPNLLVRQVRRAELLADLGIQNLCESVQSLVVDVDDFADVRRLARLLIALRERPGLKKIMLLRRAEESGAQGELSKLLEGLAGVSPFVVVPKPMELSDLIQLVPATARLAN